MEKKIERNNKKVASRYLHLVKRTLVGSWGVKVMAMRDLRAQVLNYVDNFAGEITLEQLMEEVGTPQVVAESYFSKSDLDLLKKRARRYFIWRTVAIVAIVCFVIAAFFAFYYHDNMYTVVYGDVYTP